jgi:elongation factor G
VTRELKFKESLSGQCVDRVYVAPVERGINIACTEGVLAGYRVVDVQTDFYDGKMHDVDSNDISFQLAGYWAFKEAFAKARPCLLEPIHDIEVRIRKIAWAKSWATFRVVRGIIHGIDVDGAFQVIRAEVPAMQLYRYSSQLRSLTGGRGVHTEHFSHYAEMPREIEQRVIEEAKARRAHK